MKEESISAEYPSRGTKKRNTRVARMQSSFLYVEAVVACSPQPKSYGRLCNVRIDIIRRNVRERSEQLSYFTSRAEDKILAWCDFCAPLDDLNLSLFGGRSGRGIRRRTGIVEKRENSRKNPPAT